jgi:hypothetical protein
MLKADTKIPNMMVINAQSIMMMTESNNFEFENLTDKSKEHAISFIEGYLSALNCQYSTLQYNAVMIDTTIKNLELTLTRLKG